nr:DUF4189 domain-containing protein [Paracidovorax cattleyae]
MPERNPTRGGTRSLLPPWRRVTGVRDCVVDRAYFDQCAAAAGANGGKAGSIDTGKDESVASRRALDSCEKKAGAKCPVLCVECTRPLCIKYQARCFLQWPVASPWWARAICRAMSSPSPRCARSAPCP